MFGYHHFFQVERNLAVRSRARAPLQTLLEIRVFSIVLSAFFCAWKNCKYLHRTVRRFLMIENLKKNRRR